MSSPSPIDNEIVAAKATAQRLIEAYTEFGGRYKTGEVGNLMYSEILEIVNFRLETAASCLLLIDNEKIADSLGLCRSLLENYLLIKLICRGNKYFQLRTFESLTEAQFKQKVKEEQKRVASELEAGTSTCLEARAYPRAKRHIMYVFEGLKDSENPGFTIPIHYFHFKEFHPETMRLKDEDYFAYYEEPADLKKKRKAFMQEEAFRYRHYLSYDALLECLTLNGLSDKAMQARIDAHYTFLGKFLHPTYEAGRELHEQSNYHHGGTGVGLSQPYSKSAVLLACVYVCHLVADILDDVAYLFESAPPTYIADPGTSDIRQAASEARSQFHYFWLMYNEPTLYDKFLYAIHYVSDEDLTRYGGYAGLPCEMIPFNQHIFGQFQSALAAWSNVRTGKYPSPLQAG